MSGFVGHEWVGLRAIKRLTPRACLVKGLVKVSRMPFMEIYQATSEMAQYQWQRCPREDAVNPYFCQAMSGLSGMSGLDYVRSNVSLVLACIPRSGLEGRSPRWRVPALHPILGSSLPLVLGSRACLVKVSRMPFM